MILTFLGTTDNASVPVNGDIYDYEVMETFIVSSCYLPYIPDLLLLYLWVCHSATVLSWVSSCLQVI